MKHTRLLQLVLLIGSLVVGCDRHRPPGIRGASKPTSASDWSSADIAARPAEFLAAAERQVAAAIATGELKVLSLDRHRLELSDRLKTLHNPTSGQPDPLEQDYALAIEQATAELEHARASLTELKSRRDQLVIGRERVELKVNDQDIYKAVESSTSALILADREFPPGSVPAPVATGAPGAPNPAAAQSPAGSLPMPPGPSPYKPYPADPAGGLDPAVNQAIAAVDAAIRQRRFDDALEQCRRAALLRTGATPAAAARNRTLDAIYDEARRLEGRGGNAGEVIQLYRKAAENSHVGAQLNLGNIYREGRIVQRNPTEAMKWYRLAAGQGYDKAQANLGMMLYERGTPQEKAEGVQWLQQAARNGNAAAQGVLNQLHMRW
ncbi:MAG: tetratricopeptide repeat protein [Tepidisphaeraceae bacterium]|jgi:hypothetical protein